MERHARVWKVLAGLLSLATGAVLAGDTEVTSRVVGVTIFPDRALVTREGQANLPAGQTSLLFQGLPAELNGASLRVSCSPRKNLRIVSVEIAPVHMVDLVRGKEKELNDALLALQDRSRALTDRIAAAQLRLELIRSLGKEAPKTAGEEISRGKLDAESWRLAWKAVEEGSLESLRQIQACEQEMRQVTAESEKLKKEISEIRTGSRDTLQSRVVVEAAASVQGEFALSYEVVGPSWQPAYDARLEGDGGRVSVEQFAEVMQNTGEDWKDVRLTLSTARPGEGMRAPDLGSWTIGMAPIARSGGGVAYLAPSVVTSGLENSVTVNGVELSPTRPEEDYSGYELDLGKDAGGGGGASVQSGEYTAEYVLSTRVDVPSDNQGHRYEVFQHSLEIKLSLRVAPKVFPRAFFVAKGTYQGPVALLPGTVNLYRDGAFVGTDEFPMVRTGGDLELPFGIDDKVLVSYKRAPEVRTTKGRNERVDRVVEMTLSNQHAQAVEIMVLDQLPVSRDPRIDVRLSEETAPAPQKDFDRKEGVLAWSRSVQPKEAWIIRFGYTIQFPKGVQLSD